MKKAEWILWMLFKLLIVVTVINIIGSFFDIQYRHDFFWFNPIFLGIPVILLLIHSVITLSMRRAIIFILLAAGVGTVMEYIGLKYGTFFGGNYRYDFQLTLFTVPVSVIFYWAVFIYTGYCLTNSFLYWLKKDKPDIKRKNLYLLPLCILLDGYFVTTIDLFIDPIAVKFGRWKWLEGGPYFGIPIGNFIGWFIVAIITVLIFRTYEYYFPLKNKMNKSIYIIPVLGYGAMAVSCFFIAIRFNQFFAFIGLLWMLPQVIINIFLFSTQIKNSHISD